MQEYGFVENIILFHKLKDVYSNRFLYSTNLNSFFFLGM